MIRIAQGKTGDFKNALQDLDIISKMVQEMDQALTQEINRHQNGSGSASDTGASVSGNCSISSGYGSGGNGP